MGRGLGGTTLGSGYSRSVANAVEPRQTSASLNQSSGQARQTSYGKF